MPCCSHDLTSPTAPAHPAPLLFLSPDEVSELSPSSTPVEVVNYLATHTAALDLRRVAVLLQAGATQLHLPALDALLQQPVLPGWRLWRADVGHGDVAPAAECRSWLPGDCASISQEGTLEVTPVSWMQCIADAASKSLQALAVECDEETDVCAPAMHHLLSLLPPMPPLTALAIGFMDTLTDELLSPLLFLRQLTTLHLSHIPHLSDTFSRDICASLTALVRLRCDCLSISDAGMEYLPKLTALRWLEIRACPFIELSPAFPLGALRRLTTLRLDPPGGDIRMALSPGALTRLADVVTTLHTLELGVHCTDPQSIVRRPFFSGRVPPRLCLYAPEHLAWAWDTTWAGGETLKHLVLLHPFDPLLKRMGSLTRLRSLRICDCAALTPAHIRCLALAKGLETVILGGISSASVATDARATLTARLPHLGTLHIHSCLEMAARETFWSTSATL